MPSAERMINVDDVAIAPHCPDPAGAPIRWTVAAIEALFDAAVHRAHVPRADSASRAPSTPNAVQLSTLLSIKTGGCPEDCGYCPQAARYHTGVDDEAAAASTR